LLTTTYKTKASIFKNTYVFGAKYVRKLREIRTYFSVNTYVLLELAP